MQVVGGDEAFIKREASHMIRVARVGMMLAGVAMIAMGRGARGVGGNRLRGGERDGARIGARLRNYLSTRQKALEGPWRASYGVLR